MTAPASATPSEMTAIFGLSEKTSYHLSARDFERGTQAVHGKAISVLESPNVTTHEYCDVGTEPPSVSTKTTSRRPSNTAGWKRTAWTSFCTTCTCGAFCPQVTTTSA